MNANIDISFIKVFFNLTLVLSEMSDQNFVDEEVKGKKQNKKSKVKRQRSLISDAQSNDQVIFYFIS